MWSLPQDEGSNTETLAVSAGRGHGVPAISHDNVSHETFDDVTFQVQQATADPVIVCDGRWQNALPGQSGFMSLIIN